MRLYRFPHSCYARFVQAAIELAGVPCDVIDVPYGDRDALATLTGGWIEVPVVVTDDGQVMVESRRMMATLVRDDPRFAALVPEADAGPVWAHVEWALGPVEDVAFRLASPGVAERFARPFERALFVYLKERKFGAGAVAAWERDADRLAARLDELLAPTARSLRGRAFLLGERATLADAALYGQLAMLEIAAVERVAALDPAILAWKERFEHRLGGLPYGPITAHRSTAALDGALAAAGGARTGALELIVVRTSMHARACPAEIEVATGGGLAGDRWAIGGRPEAAVSLMDVRCAGAIADRADWPLFGDNLFVDLDLDEAALPPGTRLALGDVVLEATGYPHTGCRKFLSRFGADALRWVNHKATRAERRRGVFARVVSGGTLRTGAVVRVLGG